MPTYTRTIMDICVQKVTGKLTWQGHAHHHLSDSYIKLKTGLLRTRMCQSQTCRPSLATSCPRHGKDLCIQRLPAHLGPQTHPLLTGTSNASWVSSSIWILMDMSFPEGVGGGFCPCSRVLIPEFSGAPSRDPGVGFCSISPMMKVTYKISAGSSEKEKHIRRPFQSLK